MIGITCIGTLMMRISIVIHGLALPYHHGQMAIDNNSTSTVASNTGGIEKSKKVYRNNL